MKGKEKILKLFYENQRANFHLREIARRTQLNENSVYRFLQQLESEKVLVPVKEANLKKYSLQKSLSAYATLSVLDIQRFTSLPEIRKKAIHLFLDSLPEKPIITLLFGSTAKNTYTKESDIDLLLIVNKRIDTIQAKNLVDAQTAMQISDFQIEIPTFKEEIKRKEDKVIQAALTTGYPITNHIEYYRTLYDETP